MGGTKRAIPIENITNKAQRAVAFSKRRPGLYRKATKLCLVSGGQLAILATPVSDNSHVSFYSYGSSSVDSILSALLENERPKVELGLRRWWEDEGLLRSEDCNELKSAVESMSSMLKDLEALRSQKHHEELKEELVLHETQQEQTLTLQWTSESGEEDLMLAVSENNNKNDNSLVINLDECSEEFDQDRIFDLVAESEGVSKNLETDNVLMETISQNPWSDEVIEDGELVMIHSDNGQVEDVKEKKELVLYGAQQEQPLNDLQYDQIAALYENNNNNYNNGFVGELDGLNDEFFDVDELLGLVENWERDNVSRATTSQIQCMV